MRGSVYYQTGQLTQSIFIEGAKKYEKIDPSHPYYQCISSYKTMKTYREVWNNLGNYLKEHWKIKDLELITEEHIDAYISYKIEYYPTKQYLEKITSAIGKLEWALRYLCRNLYGEDRIYNFNIRHRKLHYAKVQNLVADGYHNRVYQDPHLIIDHLSCEEHKIAAHIQLEGGARSEGVTLIKRDQLITDIYSDEIMYEDAGVIMTKEKGGKEGEVIVSLGVYLWLERYYQFNNTEIFKISYQAYAKDIREVCLSLGIKPEGSHGFRWTFARNRVRAYQNRRYTYEQALQAVSWEMKHFRPDITQHYLG